MDSSLRFALSHPKHSQQPGSSDKQEYRPTSTLLNVTRPTCPNVGLMCKCEKRQILHRSNENCDEKAAVYPQKKMGLLQPALILIYLTMSYYSQNNMSEHH